MQICEYFFENACYSVTKYYLCKQNNKRSLLGRKQQSQVARSFPNRYLFSYTNKVTSLFSISCILDIILPRNMAHFVAQSGWYWKPIGLIWENSWMHVGTHGLCVRSCFNWQLTRKRLNKLIVSRRTDVRAVRPYISILIASPLFLGGVGREDPTSLPALRLPFLPKACRLCSNRQWLHSWCRRPCRHKAGCHRPYWG